MEAIRHEVEVDRALAELWRENATLSNRLDSLKHSLASSLKVRGEYVRKTYTIRQSIDELLAMDASAMPSWDRKNYDNAVTGIADTRAALALNRETAQPLEAEHARDQWSRFFLVTNSNGHIHATMACSTCRPTTLFAWLPELSGLTDKDAVEAHGPHLCSVCFPTAPVEWTVGKAVEVDPDQCPGSGTYDLVEGTHRLMGWNGNGRATCSHCKRSVATTSTHKLRKHKRS